MILTIFISCSSDNERPYDPFQEGMDIWMEYVKTTDGYSAMKAYTSSENDSIIFSGFKNDKLWFAIFNPKTKEKLLEWIDDVSFEKKYRIDKGYGEVIDFKTEAVMPILYRQYAGKETVVFNLHDDVYSGIISYCEFRNDDFFWHHGRPTSLWNVIVYKDKFGRRQSSLFYMPSPAWIHNGYRESFIANNYCISMGDTICEMKINEYNDIFWNKLTGYDGFVSYLTAIRKPVLVKDDKIEIMREQLGGYGVIDKTWTATISAPFDIPSDAKPRIKCSVYEKGELMWKYQTNLLYYDGTKKHFKFSLNMETGEYDYLNE